MSKINGEWLYGVASSGKIKVWKASTDFQKNDEGHVTILVEWGYENGKIQTKERVVKKGKNIGKSNETTVEQQAELSLASLYQAQLDSHYVYKEDLDHRLANPPRNSMLAKVFQERLHKLPMTLQGVFTEKVYLQPKFNGIRCEGRHSDGGVSFVSRTNKPFQPFKHLIPTIEKLMPKGCSFDGELFNPKIRFEYISSLVNSESTRDVWNETVDPPILYEEDDIKYYVYDLYGYDHLTFTERLAVLTELSKDFSPDFVLTETVEVASLEEIYTKTKELIAQGYEGAMVRVGSSYYEYNKRSDGLLKYKLMQQEEFRITAVYAAENNPDKPMFTCYSELASAEFNCSLEGSVKENKKYLEDPSKWVGSYLTVDFQDLTINNLPTFPVGVGIRAGTVVDGVFVPEV